LNKGSLTLPIRVFGYKDSPGDAEGHWGDDAYRAVIDADHTLANAINVDPELSGPMFLIYEFANIRFINATGMGVALENWNSAAFYNCGAENNGEHGFDLGQYSQLIGCQASGNGGYGINMKSASHVHVCLVHDNGNHQINGGGRVGFTVVYGIPNGKRGINLAGLTIPDAVQNCVIDGTLESGSNTGIFFAGYCSALINSIIYRCTVGVALDYILKRALACNNLYNGNVTDRQDWPADRTGAVSGDPMFEDAGGHDYRLRLDSPAAGAGWPAYLDVGAFQRRAVLSCSPTHVGMQT
jgi:hypothetical protein